MIIRADLINGLQATQAEEDGGFAFGFNLVWALGGLGEQRHGGRGRSWTRGREGEDGGGTGETANLGNTSRSFALQLFPSGGLERELQGMCGQEGTDFLGLLYF